MTQTLIYVIVFLLGAVGSVPLTLWAGYEVAKARGYRLYRKRQSRTRQERMANAADSGQPGPEAA